MSAHAIGNNGKRHSTTFLMGNYCNAILLLLAVNMMPSDASIYRYWHYYDSLQSRKSITFG